MSDLKTFSLNFEVESYMILNSRNLVSNSLGIFKCLHTSLYWGNMEVWRKVV